MKASPDARRGRPDLRRAWSSTGFAFFSVAIFWSSDFHWAWVACRSRPRATLSCVDTAKDVIPSAQRPDVHTPSTLLNAFTARLSAPEDSRVLCLRGVYHRKGNKLYGSGYAYDELQEETSDSRLTLQVPGPLRGGLRDGLPYVLKGSLAKVPRSNRGTIELHFVVADVLEELEPRFTEDDMRLAKLLSQKGEVGFKNVDAVLRHKLYDDEKPVLTLLYGVTAVVDADVREALAEAEGRYELLEMRVSLTDPTGLAQALRDAQGDAVAVVRGGGAGMEALSHPDLLETALGLGLPLITALGHAVDAPLLEQTADKRFPTPTAFGTYLRSLAETVDEERAGAKATLVKQVERQFEAQLKTAAEQLEHKDQRLEALAAQLGRLQGQGSRVWLWLLVAFAVGLGIGLAVYLASRV